METPITITNITAGGAGFALTPEGDTVFVPRRIIDAAHCALHGRYDAVVQDNRFEPDKARYMAIYVMPPGAPRPVAADEPARAYAPAQEATSIPQRALSHLIANPAVAKTVRELADEFGGPDWQQRHGNDLPKAIFAALNAAHDRGALARADIFSSPDQTKPSRVRWSAHWRSL